jgi:hypothetical protein
MDAPPDLTDHFVPTREAAIKLAGKPQFDLSDCALVTPVEHAGHLYHRRCISHRRTIYHTPTPAPTPAPRSTPPTTVKP